MTGHGKALWFVALLALAAAAPLGGQAPVVTPVGDPSVSSDTIYALAVDPADHPEESSVLLLDDGIVIQEADGTGSRTYRTVAQVLNRDAVEQWSELTFGYDGKRARFRLNWARVVRPDGTVVTDEPIHQQTTDVPVPEQSPVYTDAKRVRVSLGGVEPGTIVDYSYTTEVIEPVMPGDFSASWSITTGSTVRRSRYVLDVPEGYDLRMVQRNVERPTRETRVDGRVVREWSAADLERIEPELFADFEEADFLQSVSVGGPNAWADIGAWYASLANDRYDIDDALVREAMAALGDASTSQEKLHALHRWVAQDFRYISISLGQGGYQPRMPAEVLRTRSGDCKDKATLFVALARELGWEAYPVLLSSTGGVEEELPAVGQFDHAIAAVRLDGEWVYLDLTAELVPFGAVPPNYQGEFGLVVFDDGSVEEITFPENAAPENLTEHVLEGELFEDGSFSGWYSERSLGALQYRLRGALSAEMSERDLDRVADAVAGNVIEGALGDSLSVFDGRDLTAEPAIRVWLRADRAARRNGASGFVLPIPLATAGSPTAVTRLEREQGTRRYPIDVASVVGPMVSHSELVLTLPEGWTAELPEGVTAESVFGSYASSYEQDGREVRIVRRLSGSTGTQPKEALPELIEWLRAVSRDDVSFLVLEPAR